jgi:hypothetical protein
LKLFMGSSFFLRKVSASGKKDLPDLTFVL